MRTVRKRRICPEPARKAVAPTRAKRPGSALTPTLAPTPTAKALPTAPPTTIMGTRRPRGRERVAARAVKTAQKRAHDRRAEKGSECPAPRTKRAWAVTRPSRGRHAAVTRPSRGRYAAGAWRVRGGYAAGARRMHGGCTKECLVAHLRDLLDWRHEQCRAWAEASVCALAPRQASHRRGASQVAKEAVRLRPVGPVRAQGGAGGSAARRPLWVRAHEGCHPVRKANLVEAQVQIGGAPGARRDALGVAGSAVRVGKDAPSLWWASVGNGR